MKYTKAIILFVLVFCLLTTIVPQGFAASIYRFENESRLLYNLGLFTGTSSTSFVPDLGAQLDRQTGITLLMNFFGKKSKVNELTPSETNAILSKYTDASAIASWARPYIAYAVKTGIVKGVSATAIGPFQPLSGTSYATMVLRFLGYSVDGSAYLSALQTLNTIGGLKSADVAYFNKIQFIKDDAVGMVYSSLYATCYVGDTLINNLIGSGIVSLDKAVSQGLVTYNSPEILDTNKQEILKTEKPSAYIEVYNIVLDAMLNAKTSINLPSNEYTDTSTEVFDIVETCIKEHPEILYFDGCTYSSRGTLTFKYRKSADIIKKHTELLLKKCDEIVQQIIKPGMTDFEKELAIHDYIIINCDYDVNALSDNRVIAPESFNAYGVLCLGTAVCEGYAEAAKMLMDRAGIECTIVIGTSKGEGHAWNQVKIAGEYYNLDITWDDPIMADGSKSIYYHYFNVTDKELSVDHAWNTQDYASCTATEYQYYVYYGLTVSSQDELINKAVEISNNGINNISIKMTNYNTSRYNIARAVRMICNRLQKQCSYSFFDTLGVLELKFNAK